MPTRAQAQASASSLAHQSDASQALAPHRQISPDATRNQPWTSTRQTVASFAPVAFLDERMQGLASLHAF